jgi:bifunctional non-homologous end joining protein LigD
VLPYSRRTHLKTAARSYAQGSRNPTPSARAHPHHDRVSLHHRTDDALRGYRAKRNFALTPEPEREAAVRSAEQPAFVVQKHWASSLHYDFRLELNGTLKSWAVPKGPSLDPKVKRMAVQVEDHPLSYASFEGTIPAKQYGAGKVIVWDTGTWTPLHDADQGYSDGNLKFVLHGHKLTGKWVLVRMKGKGEKQAAWLLIKEKDAFARTSAECSVVDEFPDSVNDPKPPLRSAALAPALVPAQAPAQAPTQAPTQAPAQAPAHGLPPGALPCTLPPTLSPQLATLATLGAGTPPGGADWLYEIKFDGYRMLVRNDASGARLFTRNGHDWTAKLGALKQDIETLNLPPGWYDGEIVMPGEAGIPDFGALQRAFDSRGAQRSQRSYTTTDDIVLYLFDLPYAAGHDLRSVPLDARRALLKSLLAASTSERVRFSEEFVAAPESVIASACKLGLEGVIAKRRSAPYQSSRSADWVKLKCGQRQEFVIGGYTEPQGTRQGFGALVLGVHDAQGLLQYAGDVGTGFSEQALKDIRKQLGELSRAHSPFAPGTKIEGRPHWVTPTRVAEVSFGEWTRAGRIRHAVFRGLRVDKDASTIVRERAVTMATQKASRSAGKAEAQSLPARLRVTNPERVIDASTGTTKMDVVRYYSLVGDLMMRHLAGRPVLLVRAPDGVAGELFFQKHADTDKLPGIVQLDPSLNIGMNVGMNINHAPLIEVASKQGLLSAAQWNVIELHTMNTGTVSFDHPDRMVFDLDPGDGVAWTQVKEAAQLMHSFLTQLGLPAFLKTSGGKGLHVVVPLRRVHDWDTLKGFSQAVVQHMANTIPQRFVARSGPRNRVGKIYIDYLRNGMGATTVCAWSARARPGLGISVPVDWAELPSLRGGDHWTLKTVHSRLDTGNEPWKGYARAARGLASAMSALGYALPTKVPSKVKKPPPG